MSRTTSTQPAVSPVTSRRVRIPIYLQVSALAMPLLVLTQFSLVAVLPLAVLVIGTIADRRARVLRWWTAALAVAYLTPLAIWMLRTDPAQSMSEDMHPAFSALIAVAGAAVLAHIYWRRPRRA